MGCKMSDKKYVKIVSSTPVDPNQYSWGENYAGSSGLMSSSPDMNPMQRARSGTVSSQEAKRDPIWLPDAGSLQSSWSLFEIFDLFTFHWFLSFSIFSHQMSENFELYLIFHSDLSPHEASFQIPVHLCNRNLSFHFLSTRSSVFLTLSFSFP